MLKEHDRSRNSLSRCALGVAWLLVLAIVGRYIMTDLAKGAEIGIVIGALLAPAYAGYWGREHTKKGA